MNYYHFQDLYLRLDELDLEEEALEEPSHYITAKILQFSPVCCFLLGVFLASCVMYLLLT